MADPTPAGLLLAAGAGRRMGGPKALVELAGRPLILRALDALQAGGCAPVVVVLGAAAEEVGAVLPADVTPVVADGWAEGMGASLRAGLAALAGTRSSAAVVHLVDLPGITPEVIARLVEQAGASPDVLARACYGGAAAHPVLLGRTHWAGVVEVSVGDAGARRYLAGHPELRLIECGDLAVASDVDTPEQLRRFAAGER